MSRVTSVFSFLGWYLLTYLLSESTDPIEVFVNTSNTVRGWGLVNCRRWTKSMLASNGYSPRLTTNRLVVGISCYTRSHPGIGQLPTLLWPYA